MQGASEQGPARCWAPPLDGEEARGSWSARDYELAGRGLAIWPDALIAGDLAGRAIWPDALIAGNPEMTIAGRR
jgi:hypothetical protein